MKKRVLFMAVLALAMVFTSCRKDEMEMLRHPIHVQGGISPNLQLPLASSATMHFGDLLGLFDSTISSAITVENDLIVFRYDTSFFDHSPLNEMTSKGHRGNAPKIITRKWIEKTVDIGLFENSDMGILGDADITIDSLMLHLSANLQTITQDTTAYRLLETYGSARIDSLHISYEGHDGTPGALGLQNVPPLVITNLTDVSTWQADVNLAEIFNKRPKSITYRFKIEVNVDNSFLSDPEMMNLMMTDPERAQAVQDSVEQAMVYYGAAVNVRFPFNVHIGGLSYSYPMTVNHGSGESNNSLQETFDKIKDILEGKLDKLIDANFDSIVILKLSVTNGIPLNIDLRSVLLNDNGDSTGLLFPSRMINAAEVVNGEVTQPTVTPSLEIPLNMTTLEKFFDADKIRMDLTLSTPGITPVKLKTTDGMSLKLYVQIHPIVEFNFDLLGGEDNENNN